MPPRGRPDGPGVAKTPFRVSQRTPGVALMSTGVAQASPGVVQTPAGVAQTPLVVAQTPFRVARTPPGRGHSGFEKNWRDLQRACEDEENGPNLSLLAFLGITQTFPANTQTILAVTQILRGVTMDFQKIGDLKIF
jgi:hypothetical protein